MRRYRKFTAVALALLASATTASAAPDWRAEAAAVTGVSVVPGAGRADVVLAIEGAVQVTDFTLDGPSRIVIDVQGATMRLRAPQYDRISRGGIVNVRIAQYQADVVRLVLDLDSAREYTVVRGDTELRVSVMGPDAFAPWSAGARAVAADAPPVVTAPAPAASSTSGAAGRIGGPPAGGRSFAPPQQSAEPRINTTFVNADIHTVITQFSDFSGRTILAGPGVTGRVTASIPGQPWDVALNKILQMNGLSAVEDSTGIITIDSYTNLARRVAAEPLVSQVVPVNYAKASELATTIRQLIAACSSGDVSTAATTVDVAAGGDPAAAAAAAPPAADGAPSGPAPQTCGRGTVAVETKTNTLIITESVSRLPEIVSYVRDLDVRTPQVAIKAKIISVDRTATEELGISYDIGSRNIGGTAWNTLNPRGTPGEFTIDLGGDAFAGVTNANRTFGSTAALSLIFNTAVRGYNLAAFIDALSQEQLSDVQAEPSTTTIDNRKATLFAGTEIAFLLTPPTIPGQIQAVAPQLQRQRVGITLEVTPHVTANRQISMEIFAQQQTQLGITIAGPEIADRSATNEVLVADGETAVIAGLTQTQVTRLKNGIPFLMNIPIIGRLFSETRVQERKQDLLILVTPHIVDEGEVIRSNVP